jgi:hypothetical protein
LRCEAAEYEILPLVLRVRVLRVQVLRVLRVLRVRVL